VWVTAQAIAAARRKALPLKPVPRSVKRSHVQPQRTAQPHRGRAKPIIERAKTSHSARAAITPRALRPALASSPAAPPAAAARHVPSGAADAGGSSLLPALGITGAVLVAGAALFAFRRTHV
jgi:hypothetical protein